MGYKRIGSQDNYNFQSENHYTEEVEYEVEFEEVFNGVEISFGKDKEGYLDALLEELTNRGFNGVEVNFLEVDTGNGELLFKVCKGKQEEILSITPKLYSIDSSVTLEELVGKDNEKLEQEIVEYLEIDSEDIKEALKEINEYKIN